VLYYFNHEIYSKIILEALARTISAMAHSSSSPVVDPRKLISVTGIIETEALNWTRAVSFSRI